MSRIILPENFKKIITEPSYVENGINYYWNNHQNHIKNWLGPHLEGSKKTYLDLESNPPEKGFSTNLDNPEVGYGTFRSNLRHSLGYSALPELTPINLEFQLWSPKAIEIRKAVTNPRASGCMTTCLPKNTLVEDHFCGSTASAVRLFKTYRDSNWDLHYILNEWLPNELINYITVIILHNEHQENTDTGKKGIARGDVFTLDEKIQGKHYLEADIELPLIVTDEEAQIITMENNTFKPMIPKSNKHPFFNFT